ncbi:MAG: DNA repair exonuclease SbcCD ATPase subunit [Verrucomicrobiales bacterium]|jgi:DNA repair exonuclease SbcCD ATPase subunit
MNAIGFAIRRVARSFGIKNEMNRRMAITRELQLLAEAEAILGRIACTDSENIEEIAEEFYQVRDLEAEAVELRKEIRHLEIENDRLLVQQEKLEENLENQIGELTRGKSGQMQRTIALMNEIENLKLDAEITRKKYSGMKLRLKSLIDSDAPEEELELARQNLIRLKAEYSAETKQIVGKQADVRNTEQAITDLENKVTNLREDARARITSLMNDVGKSSNLVARYGAKLGSIEKNIGDLTYSVGSFLSNNSDNPTAEIKTVIHKHRAIISRLNSLKASINFNRILSGQAG